MEEWKNKIKTMFLKDQQGNDDKKKFYDKI